MKLLPAEKFFLPKESRKPDTIKGAGHTPGAKYVTVTSPQGVWNREPGGGAGRHGPRFCIITRHQCHRSPEGGLTPSGPVCRAAEKGSRH